MNCSGDYEFEPGITGEEPPRPAIAGLRAPLSEDLIAVVPESQALAELANRIPELEIDPPVSIHQTIYKGTRLKGRKGPDSAHKVLSDEGSKEYPTTKSLLETLQSEFLIDEHDEDGGLPKFLSYYSADEIKELTFRLCEAREKYNDPQFMEECLERGDEIAYKWEKYSRDESGLPCFKRGESDEHNDDVLLGDDKLFDGWDDPFADDEASVEGRKDIFVEAVMNLRGYLEANYERNKHRRNYRVDVYDFEHNDEGRTIFYQFIADEFAREVIGKREAFVGTQNRAVSFENAKKVAAWYKSSRDVIAMMPDDFYLKRLTRAGKVVAKKGSDGRDAMRESYSAKEKLAYLMREFRLTMNEHAIGGSLSYGQDWRKIYNIERQIVNTVARIKEELPEYEAVVIHRGEEIPELS